MEIKRREVKKKVIETTPTGCTILDLALSPNPGGAAWSKVVNIVGDRSTGKTLLVCEIIAQARKKYGNKFAWFYDDAECGFSFDTESMYGFRILPPDKYRSITVEDFMSNLKKRVSQAREKGFKYFIYVNDSFDAMSSEAEMERGRKRMKAKEEGKEYTEGTYNLEKQRMVNEFFRTELEEIFGNGYMLIVISQCRQNIGITFRKPRRHCEDVLNFYSSQIIWLSEVEKHKSKGRATGVSIKAQVAKNKIGKPFREVFFDILFDYGIDDIASCVDFVFDLKTETGKSKKAVNIEWDKRTFKNRDKLIQYIDDKGQEALIQKEAIKKWEDIEKEISPKRKPKYT